MTKLTDPFDNDAPVIPRKRPLLSDPFDIPEKPKPTYAESRQNQHLLSQFEARLKAGETLRPAEEQTFRQLVARRALDQGVTDETDARYRGAQKGLSFNLADEVGGAVKSVFGDNSYEYERDMIREKDRIAKEKFPSEFGSAELAGALATVVGPTGYVGLAGKGAGLAGKMAHSALAGGLTEGGRAYADGEGIADRAEKAAIPALVGAGVGAAVPVVGAGVKAGVRALANPTKPVTGLSRHATKTIQPAFNDSADSLGEDVHAFLNKLGAHGTPADVPGGLQHQASGLATIGGPGGSQLSRTLSQRATGSEARIRKTLDQHITGPNTAFEQKQALAAERTHRLGPEYERALRVNQPIETGALRQRLAQAHRLAGPSTADSIAKLARGLRGEVPAAKLHAIRSDLSDQISEAVRAGRNKQALALQQHLDDIDEMLYDAVPGYRDAQRNWANNKALEEQIALGRKDLQGNRNTAQDVNEFTAEFSQLSPAQQEARRAGMRRDIEGMMGTARNAPAKVWGDLTTGWNDQKMRIALGQESADAVLNRMHAEHLFSQTRGKVDSGSQTAARTASRARLGGADPSAGSDLLKSLTTDKLRNWVVEPLFSGPRRTALNTDLGKFYSSQGSQRDQMIMDLLTGKAKPERLKRTSDLSRLVVEYLMRGGVVASNSK